MLRLEDALGELANCHKPVIAFGINAMPERDKLAERIAWFKQTGYGGLLLIAEGGIPFQFMSDGWLDQVGIVLELAKQNGLDVWIWDDWTFPSGFGGGLVTANPEFRARKLHVAVDLLLDAGQAVSLVIPERAVAAGTVRVNKYVYYSPAGEWSPLAVKAGETLDYQAGSSRERLVIVTWEIFSFHEISTTGNDAEDPAVSTVDMLNAQATQRYLEVIHERYAARFQAEFGATIKGFFYDEPEMPYAYPWTNDFSEQFIRRKGYDLRVRLPELMVYLPMAYMGLGGPLSVVTGIESLARDYYDVWTDLVAENFFGKLEGWCHSHGLASIGHQDMDNKMNTLASVSGHFFKNSQRNDHPGIDVIWEQVAPGHFNDFPRYAGSVARIYGKAQAMSESLAEMGAGMHADATRYIMEQQILRNVTQFILCTSVYQYRRGVAPEPAPQKTNDDPEVAALVPLHKISGIPLLSSDLNPENPVLAAFGAATYQRTARVSALMNTGISTAEIAVYVPMFDIYLEQGRLAHPHTSNMYPPPWDFPSRIAECLAYLPVEFDYIWDEAILDLEIASGFKTRAGNTYQVVILPPRVSLCPAVVGRLQSFIKAGGKLIMVEEPLAELGEEAIFCIGIVELAQYLPKRVSVTPSGAHFSVAGRMDGDREVIMLLNEDLQASQVTLYFTGQGRILEMDPWSGEITSMDVKAPGELSTWFDQTALKIFILEKQNELKAAPATQPDGKGLLLDQWRLTLPDGKKIQLSGVLPEWGTLGFPNYSGWMAYDTDFTWEGPETTAQLDLGEVCYAAEVFLDQTRAATAPFRPYRMLLPGLTSGSHHLEVRVLNSLANQTCGSRERERALYGSSSHPMLVADRRKIRSGMMGPVMLHRMKEKG